MTQFLMAVSVLFWISLFLPEKSQAEDNSVESERIDPFGLTVDLSLVLQRTPFPTLPTVSRASWCPNIGLTMLASGW